MNARAFGLVDTFAGTGFLDFEGDGGPATDAGLGASAVAVGPDGSIYIAGGQRVRRVDPDGTITTFAGSSDIFGFGGDGGPATSALLDGPADVSVGPDGSVYIADPGNFRIRRVDPDGIISTFAGNGEQGSGGDNGPATQAQFSRALLGVDAAPDGSVYIADSFNHKIRRVDPDGIITTFAGIGGSGCCLDGKPANEAGLSLPFGVSFGSDGSVYIADTGNARIRRVKPDGIIETIIDLGRGTSQPDDVAIDRNGNLYIADQRQNRIFRLEANGLLQTFAGTGSEGFSGDGGLPLNAEFKRPTHLVVTPDNTILIADTGNNRVRQIDAVSSGFSGVQLEVASLDGGGLYRFDATGRHLQTVDTLTGTVRYDFGYDSNGLLVTVTDANDNITTIDRDEDGNPSAIVAPFGQRTMLGIDTDGYLAAVTDPSSASNTFSYTVDGLLVQSTDPRGGVSNYSYDTPGRLERAEDRAEGAQDFVRTASDSGFEVDRTTSLGLTTRYRVEDRADDSQFLTVVTPDLLTRQSEILLDGSIVITMPDGTIETREFGPDPRFDMQAPVLVSRSVTLPSTLSLQTSVTREIVLGDPLDPLSLSSMSEQITVAGETSTFVTDARARTVTMTSPEGRGGQIGYDDLGRLASFTGNGFAPTTIEYTPAGSISRVTTGTGASARQISALHDSAGRLSRITDPLGVSTEYSYDDAGRWLTTTRPDGENVAFEWDDNGNLLSLTAPGRSAWRFAYDERDDLVSVTPPALPDTGPILYAMDTDGRLVTTTRPTGDILTLSYDGAGRVVSRTLSRNSQPVATFTVSYDAAGRVASETAPSGTTVTYSYDGLLTLGSEWTGPIAGKVSQSFGPDFRPQSQSVDDAFTVNYSWDRDGRMIGAGDLAITRDPVTASATATTLGVAADAFDYDVFGGVNSYEMTVGGPAPLYSVAYVRDPLGRITERTETIESSTRTFAYTYDVMGRLTDVQRDGTAIEQYSYDLNGNRTTAINNEGTITASYDVQDRLINRGSSAYSYDADGRLTAITDPGGTTSFEYDALGMLEQVLLPDGRTIAYLSDSQGRRIGKTIDGTLVQGFLYGGLHRLVAEVDGTTGTLLSRFVYASGLTPVWMMKGGKQYRLLTDAVGSVRLVVDAATGAIAQRLDYDAFGNVILDTSPGFQPFGFAAGLRDADTGLVRFGLRDYDPTAGRFTTRDPILFGSGQTNFYVYAGNDPINGADPLGLDDTDVWTTRAAGAVVGVVEGVMGVLSVIGFDQSISSGFEGAATLLDLFGVVNYNGDNVGISLELAGLQDEVDRSSWDFLGGEACGLLASSFFGGGAAAAGEKALASTAARASSHFVENAAAKAPASFARQGGPKVLSRTEANKGIQAIIESELKPASQEAQSVGLQLIKSPGSAGNIKRTVRGPKSGSL
ncbi:MAG: hypothetical protein JRG94_09590 [Deltaproteobacteria bacterium]|nr:hypothetical protein [Deltaproteobacteria bacterium]